MKIVVVDGGAGGVISVVFLEKLLKSIKTDKPHQIIYEPMYIYEKNDAKKYDKFVSIIKMLL